MCEDASQDRFLEPLLHQTKRALWGHAISPISLQACLTYWKTVGWLQCLMQKISIILIWLS